MSKEIFSLIHIVLAITLIGFILLQSKGIGLGNIFASSSSFQTTKRGVERLVFILTVILSALFLVSSIIQTLIFR